MDIFIPSRGRPLKQTTFDNLPKELQERTLICVQGEDYEAYTKAGYEPLLLPDNVRGIGAVRHYLLTTATNSDKVVMLDDDLVFAVRRKDDPAKFIPAGAIDIVRLFDEIDEALQEFVHVGVGTREGGNRICTRTYQVNRMLRILAYHVHTYKVEAPHFDRLPVMEDFDVTLSLLREGYPNLIINWIVHNQNGSNLDGGCSIYRDSSVQEEAAFKLAKLHHPFVRTVTKTPKQAWGGHTRVDVVVQWKKAYASSE